MVFVQDTAGRHLVTWSPRRQEWGAPGGWREPGETPLMNAVRETEEESGLRLTPANLRPVGYERFRRPPGQAPDAGLWRPGQDILQAYATRLPVHRPALRAEHPGQAEPEWIDDAELAARCAASFWWPLAARVLGLAAPAR
ncbi:MAG: NUDIX domain-containing protein [Actinomycetia bacterium]|nr:NUDIX domain-containing protein [Actinomycetes bacterium]